ncbi:Rho termination factor N-terminal domain-containing protein, partial [Actinokineospora sp.]
MSNTELLSSETATDTASADKNGAPKRRAGLSGMVLAELRTLAGELGISGTTGMRKGDLIAAIKERQGGGPGGAAARTPRTGTDAAPAQAPAKTERPKA